MDELATQLHSFEDSPKENEILLELYENLQFLKHELNHKFVSEMKQCETVCKKITKTIEDISAFKNTK